MTVASFLFSTSGHVEIECGECSLNRVVKFIFVPRARFHAVLHMTSFEQEFEEGSAWKRTERIERHRALAHEFGLDEQALRKQRKALVLLAYTLGMTVFGFAVLADKLCDRDVDFLDYPTREIMGRSLDRGGHGANPQSAVIQAIRFQQHP